MKDIINNLKKYDRWRIQLTIAITFVSSKDNDEECVIHSKSDKTENMSNDKAGEVIEEPFQSLYFRYEIGLETIMKGSDFALNCVHLVLKKCHKMNLNQGGTYIDSLDWIKKMQQ